MKQGETANFDIKVSATGNVACGTSHSATVAKDFSLDDQANLSVGAFSGPLLFPSGGTGTTGNCPITGGPYTVQGSISADQNTPVGTYTDKIVWSEAQNTTTTTDSNSTGGKLDDNTATKITVVVEAGTPANTAPVVDTAANDADGTEGDTLSASGAFSDADGDTLTLSADNTEGDFTDNGDGTWSWSLSTNDDVAGGTITVTADDGNGGTVTDDFTYSAANADPSATFTAPDQADEGSNFNLSLSDVQDAGSADTHEYRFDCGDGNGFGDWSTASSVQCSAGDGPNTLNVKGQVRDDDGGLSAEYSDSVTVNNLAPIVTLSGPSSVNENKNGSENYTFTVSDPGGDTITSVSADCDDDSGTDDGFLQGSQPTVSNKSFSCRFPDGPASALVKASATDDGATGSDSKTVSIANVAPTLSNLQLTNATGTACIGGNTDT